MRPIALLQRIFYWPLCRFYAKRVVGDRPADTILAWLSTLQFRVVHGFWPDLKHPRRFSEKLWWRMLYARDPILTQLSDKLGVREYVQARVGESRLVPLIWSGERPEDIPFGALPTRFVAKANHGCAYNVIVRDLGKENQAAIVRRLRRWLRLNFCDDTYLGIAWGYKHIEPAVLVEHYLEQDGKPPVDFKFYCFDGVVEVVSVHFDRFGQHRTLAFDRAFQPHDLRYDFDSWVGECARPAEFEEMVSIAETLAAEFTFMRVDLYNVGGTVIVSELTPYPGGVSTEVPPFGHRPASGSAVDGFDRHGVPAANRGSRSPMIAGPRARIRDLASAYATRFGVRCDTRSWRYRRLERRVPQLHLPNALLTVAGEHVSSPTTWFGTRRPELLELFRAHEYGRAPSAPAGVPHALLDLDESALDGLATRKQVRIGLCGDLAGPTCVVLTYIPNTKRQAGVTAPLFLGLNFFGNHTVCDDEDILIPESWIPVNSVTRGAPPHLLRGVHASSWPVRYLLQQGYGVATAYCGEIVPDRPDARELGLHLWFRERGVCGQPADGWGAIAGWAWGLSRVLDYLCTDADVDSGRVVVVGHSRLGKVALWAGAEDERFSMVISNDSGCGGAALAMRKFGERLEEVNRLNPHWFCDNFKQFNHREEALPIDQHELVALIAPRPVYIASAAMDLRADPMGEFLAARHGSRVYELLGTSGLTAGELPPADQPVLGRVGYHIRSGCHGITPFDWHQFVESANINFLAGTDRAPAAPARGLLR